MEANKNGGKEMRYDRVGIQGAMGGKLIYHRRDDPSLFLLHMWILQLPGSDIDVSLRLS